MKDARKLLKNLETYRTRLDDDLTAERLPLGFSSYGAALAIADGLDHAIETMTYAVQLAQLLDDAADERNTQEDALR